jgi:RNA polymerase sigma-70 factor, ECF subfamily
MQRSTTTFSDEELLERARAGDRSAFRRIVERYEGQVAATVTGMLGPSATVDDVTQEVFIRFYEALHRFRGESALGTYLTRIAINLALNAAKRRKRWLARFSWSEEAQEPYVAPSDASRIAEKRDVERRVHEALETLSPAYRAVIVLRMIDGYSTKETAEILSIPVGTVLSRLSRATDRLRGVLEHYRDELLDGRDDENEH